MKALARISMVAAVFTTAASANAADPQRMFELCLWDSFSTVAGARVDGPREAPKSASRSREKAVSFRYELQIPTGIGFAGRRKLLDTFYDCLEGNGFIKHEMFWIEGSIASLKAVRDYRVAAEVTYFEGLSVELDLMRRSSIVIKVRK